MTEEKKDAPAKPDNPAQKNTLTDRVWDFFASVKLAIVLFAVISTTSVVGTVLEQNAEAQKNIAIIAKFVGESSAPALYGIFDAMGFMDMYRSWWFNALLGLFAANLIICSLDRLPPIWKMAREPLKPIEPGQFRAFPVKREFLMKGSVDSATKSVAEALRHMGFKALEQGAGAEGGIQLFSQKHAYSMLGVYITHVSIIVILVGAVVGAFLGFKGFLNIPEGWAYPVAFASRQLPVDEYQERNYLLDALMKNDNDFDRAASSLGVDSKRLKDRLKNLGAEPMGFMVKNEEFEVSFYGTSDTPKEYSSTLVVLEDGREVMRKRIEVNDPLRYKGYTLYQSSYGMMENREDFIFILDATGKTGLSERAELKIGDTYTIPGTAASFKVVDYSPALRFDASGNPSTYSEMMNNPGVRVEVTEGGTTYARWILKRYPQTWTVGEGHTLKFLDVWGAQYTGLQVRRDPGVGLVYLGCLIMSLGLYMAFFMSHRRVWVNISEGGKGTLKVMLAGSAHKGREGFERRVDEAIARLTEGGKQ